MRLRLAPCLLLLGAVLNLAVAWLCAAWLDLGGSSQATIATVGDLQEVTVTETWLGRSRINAARFSDLSLDSAGNIQVARWSGDGSERSRIQAGWPMRSFACTNVGEISIRLGSSQIGMNKSGLNPIEGGIALSPQAGTGLWRALPFQPLWRGFVVDTVFWATIGWLAIATIKAWRNERRRSRWLCVSCGYNLSGADHQVCPECGTQILAKVRAMPRQSPTF